MNSIARRIAAGVALAAAPALIALGAATAGHADATPPTTAPRSAPRPTTRHSRPRTCRRISPALRPTTTTSGTTTPSDANQGGPDAQCVRATLSSGAGTQYSTKWLTTSVRRGWLVFNQIVEDADGRPVVESVCGAERSDPARHGRPAHRVPTRPSANWPHRTTSACRPCPSISRCSRTPAWSPGPGRRRRARSTCRPRCSTS